MPTKRTTRTKRQACAEAAMRYHAPYGEALIAPALPRPPRPGYAWDMDGNEVRLVQGRRYIRRRDDKVLVEPEMGDRVVLNDDAETDE